MTLFLVIVVAILAALALWHNAGGAYQIANRITLLLLIAGVIYTFVEPAHPAERDAPTVRFYDSRGNSTGTATTYGNVTKFYAPDGRLMGSAAATKGRVK